MGTLTGLSLRVLSRNVASEPGKSSGKGQHKLCLYRNFS